MCCMHACFLAASCAHGILVHTAFRTLIMAPANSWETLWPRLHNRGPCVGTHGGLAARAQGPAGADRATRPHGSRRAALASPPHTHTHTRPPCTPLGAVANWTANPALGDGHTRGPAPHRR